MEHGQGGEVLVQHVGRKSERKMDKRVTGCAKELYET